MSHLFQNKKSHNILSSQSLLWVFYSTVTYKNIFIIKYLNWKLYVLHKVLTLPNLKFKYLLYRFIVFMIFYHLFVVRYLLQIITLIYLLILVEI